MLSKNSHPQNKYFIPVGLDFKLIEHPNQPEDVHAKADSKI